MKCLECSGKTRVLETRESHHGTRRRRECRSCGHRFTTFEAVVTRVYEQRTDSADAVEIASDVSVAVTTELGDAIENLPDEVVVRLIEAAEDMRARALSNGDRPELVAGDDWNEDDE